MAFINNSPYFGKTHQQMMVQFFTSSKTATNGLATYLLNVKGRMNLPYMTNTLNIRERDCDFTPLGTTTLDNKEINVKVYEDQMEFCKPDLVKMYDNMGIAYVAAGVPNVADPIVDFAIAQRLKQLEANWDNIIWNSDTANPVNPNTADYLQDGFIKLMNAGGPVNVGGTVITPLNVISIFESMIQGMGEELDSAVQGGDNGVYMVTSYGALRFLTNALSAIALSQYGNFEKRNWTSPNGTTFTNIWHIYGIPIVGIPNFRPDTIYLVHHDMLFVGTDVSPESMYINTIDFETTTFENKIGFKFAWVLGMQISNQSNLIVEFYNP